MAVSYIQKHCQLSLRGTILKAISICKGGAGGGGGGGGGEKGGAIVMGRSSWEEWQHGTELIDDAKLTRTLLSIHVAFNYLYSLRHNICP